MLNKFIIKTTKKWLGNGDFAITKNEIVSE